MNNGVRENVEATKAAVLNDVLANLEASICKFTSIGLEMGNCNDEIRGRYIISDVQKDLFQGVVVKSVPIL